MPYGNRQQALEDERFEATMRRLDAKQEEYEERSRNLRILADQADQSITANEAIWQELDWDDPQGEAMHEEQRSAFRNQMIEHREERIMENNRVMQALGDLDDERRKTRKAREHTLDMREAERRRSTWD